MNSFRMVRLSELMELSRGREDILIAVLDGTVDLDHPALEDANVVGRRISCQDKSSASCMHGTFVAGLLAARRDSVAPGISPDCKFLVHPIFSGGWKSGVAPSVEPDRVADCIVESVDAGARLINLSAEVIGGSATTNRFLRLALAHCMQHDVLVIASAGNLNAVGGSLITGHEWVIPVVAYSSSGAPSSSSTLGRSIGLHGLGAPGEGVRSLAPGGGEAVSVGSSAAAPFVTGTAALLASTFPAASASEIRHALLSGPSICRKTVVPPLLNAAASYRTLASL